MKLRMCCCCIVISLLLLGAQASAQPNRAEASKDLVAAIDATLKADIFTQTIAAVEVTDLASGEVVYTRNAQLLLRPASNAKLVTSAAAVLGIDSSYRFRTRLAATDSSRRNILCTGSADPLLTSQDIQKLAESAHANGLRTVDTLFLDESLLDGVFYGAGWMWDDENDPFMPYLSAFPVDGNTVMLRMKAPAQRGLPVEVTVLPSSSIIRLDNRLRSGKRSDLRVEKLPRSNTVVLRGTLAAGRRATRRVSMWRPQDVFTDILLSALRERGVQVDSAVVTSGSGHASLLPLSEVSHPLDAVLSSMNKDSDNLSAESVLRLLGGTRKSGGISAEDGLEETERLLKRAGITVEDIHLRDGSGISFYNLLTARALSSVLAAMARHPRFPRYASSLAIAGRDGTLARRMTDIEKGAFFRGKTGTVSGVSALSGYAQAPGGRLLGIVILMQNFHGRHKAYRDAQDDIVRHCIVYSGAVK